MKTLKIFSILAAMAVIFAACQKDQFRNTIGGADNAKVVSGVKWNGEIDRPFAASIDAVQSGRTNASGEKIPSNAHSAKFPSIYFIWDAKQKDNGFLKVDAKMFDTYERFTLTAKESNKYWDYVIEPQENQEQTPDNCYVFYIPKIAKNINMVFFTDWVAKECVDCLPPPVLITVPVIPVPYDCEDVIYITSTKFDITGKPIEVDPEGKWKMPNESRDIKTQWNQGVAGIDVFAKMNAPKGLEPTWIWDREFSWETGFTGSQIVVYTQEFDINGTIVEDEIPFYFACDNAAVIFVNGIRVAWTTKAFEGGKKVPATIEEGFEGLGNAHFDGSVWNELYMVDLKEHLVEGKTNIIQVLAANSANEPDPNSPNHQWDITNNPAGIIFGAVFTVWKNNPDCDVFPSGIPTFEKWTRSADKKSEKYAMHSDGFSFDVYPVINGVVSAAPDYTKYVDDDFMGGVVFMTEIPYGRYLMKEKAVDGWVFDYPEGIFFEIVRTGSGTKIVWDADVKDDEVLKIFNTEVPKVLGSPFSSVTVTNDANDPHVVPNSNHFTYAILDRAELQVGIRLDMVSGNKNNKVGEAVVFLNDDGKLQIDVLSLGTYTEFGAVTSVTKFNPGNGNVHSENYFKHNNSFVLDYSAGNDPIYLYFHAKSMRFYLP
jgi:hypothetical protein